MVAAGDAALPRVAGHLLQAQRHALALWIHADDDTGRLVALAEHFAGVADLAHPAHVTDVQQAIDTVLDLDERAIARHVAHVAGVDGARRVARGHLVPRI